MVIAIVWGTKGRSRPLGVRAFLCRGCLEVRKSTVHAIEQSDHLYLVSVGGWSESSRYQECDVCQYQEQIGPESAMVPEDQGRGLSVRQVLEKTEPPVEAARILDEGEAVGRRVPEGERQRRALDVFLAHQAWILKRTEENTGGWVGLILLGFIGLGIIAFKLGEISVGIFTSVHLLALLFWLQTRIVHRVAERSIEPRIRRFLAATGTSLKNLQRHMDGNPAFPGRLRRHLRRSRYASLGSLQPE